MHTFSGSRGQARPKRAHDDGAAAVEFALVLPILMALVMGIIQFGWYFFVANTATGAAREAARRVVVGDCWGQFQTLVQSQAPTVTSATYSPSALAGAGVGDLVTVTVVADAEIINFIPGLPSTVERQFTARLEDKTAGSAPCS